MKTSNSIRSVQSGSGMILYDTNRGGTFGANHVGAKIWTRLQQGIPVEQIVAEISDEFSIPREVIREDVRSFLRDLQNNELAK
jgi:hypothetical protein